MRGRVSERCVENQVAIGKAKLDQDLVRAFVERRASLRAIAARAGSQDAEDVVQEAFLKVVETSHKEEVRVVDHLLSRVVRCTAIDRIRRQVSRSEMFVAGKAETASDVSIDPERTLIARQQLNHVMMIIQCMPDRRREVFLLHRVQELTYSEIATRLGISLKAVEKHIHLALVQLTADASTTNTTREASPLAPSNPKCAPE